MDHQLISIYGKFVTSQTVSFSRTDIMPSRTDIMPSTRGGHAYFPAKNQKWKISIITLISHYQINTNR